MRLNTKRNYTLATNAGRVFMLELEGHNGYESTVTNAIAIQERLVGWITCQTWFIEFDRWLVEKFERDGAIVHASDLALEVASDITQGNSRFSWNERRKIQPRIIRELAGCEWQGKDPTTKRLIFEARKKCGWPKADLLK